jgi:Leucine-rich repeat (LRR) protein
MTDGRVVMVVVVVVVLSVALAAGQDLEADTRALLAFSAVHDPRGTKMGWSNRTATCVWRGITCAANRVTEVRLPGKDFRGEIPHGSLGMLTELRVVSLRNNHLTGLFPGELGDCNNLQALYLSGNRFFGPVLTLSGLWPQLSRLSLQANQ